MICIVTVYKSPNFGSYLQAKVLRETLLPYDKDVLLLDGNVRPWIYGFQWRGIIRDLCHLRFRQAWYRIYKIYHNYFLWNNLPHISLSDVQNRDDVTFVIGSDEIWNVDREICRNPLFWGEGLCGKLIAYAPSINNTSLKQLQMTDGFIKNLERFSSVSVRDCHSREVISKIIGREVPILLDPTFLQPLEYYKSLKHKKLPYKYIAIYAFSINSHDIVNIKKFAKERNLRTVYLSGLCDWCDVCLNISTDNPFLYFLEADYIVAETFHGTAFAINFKKNFISLTHDNNKIYDLLNEFGLLDRIATGRSYPDFCKIMDNEVDFGQRVGDLIYEKKQLSINYLKIAILGNV